MKVAASLTAWVLLLSLSAHSPATARPMTDGPSVAQLRKGLAAFKRHDYAAAGTLLQLPAERGNPAAQAALCFMHTYGRGVPQNYPEAANWCQRAANQGSVDGQYMLGLLYNKGHGVQEDYVEAYKWLNLAATRATGPKRDFSFRIRDNVATKMSPLQIAQAQALAIEWRQTPETENSGPPQK
jgi:TPR repeat protein